MIKYSTYKVYKNTETGEILRVALTDKEELVKIAKNSDKAVWKELDSDPNAGMGENLNKKDLAGRVD